MHEAEVIQVIRTTLLHRGSGTEENPNRLVEQFWSLEGVLLAENDPCPSAPLTWTGTSSGPGR